MKLRKDVKKLLSKPKYYGLLISKTEMSYFTIKDWIDNDSKKLTQLENIKIIEEITGLTQEEIFEKK
ncbi:hypothetical protein D1Z97_03090 [Riemerella anatipestifer]|uniref:hypothetical protein n=1 Tax=Riemerella anatipestifer TaxID=34085 RepID=UPI00129EEAD9|nr:hypothetical protein [Riemerella anatipestifer]MDY3521350.1 hypothetical protein [Riemerella anatipestifer]MDY3532625.1 hypothetical protein [Riemerella anatipestifer]MDY3534821.1 hypothetical protein [Riemerella anatipestifer]MRN00193.1 hypothetical protein [Riemerella anatipestifer]MRN02077.1 hypothetical protein [Riemerella anatipestifer]